MKTGNYQVEGGKVHRYRSGYSGYLCGLTKFTKTYSGIGDTTTRAPVTCKTCLNVMAKKGGKE